MVKKVIKRKVNAAKVTKSTGSKKQAFVISARFPNGKVIQIQAIGAEGKTRAIAMIKKHAPSAKYSIRKL